MKKLALLLACLFLAGCTEKQSQQNDMLVLDKEKTDAEVILKACTKELKICPDGSGVGRNSANNCEFDACPTAAVVKKGEHIMCTQEVKQCPDGSFVGRDSLKNCEFKPCPKDSSNLQ